jgi:hypothetical protein
MTVAIGRDELSGKRPAHEDGKGKAVPLHAMEALGVRAGIAATLA